MPTCWTGLMRVSGRAPKPILANTYNAEAEATHVAKGQMRSMKEPRKPKAKAAKKTNASNPSRKAFGRTENAH